MRGAVLTLRQMEAKLCPRNIGRDLQNEHCVHCTTFQWLTHLCKACEHKARRKEGLFLKKDVCLCSKW